MQGFEKELATCIPDRDEATRRAVAVKSALGFTKSIQLSGSVVDDVPSSGLQLHEGPGVLVQV